MTLYSGQYFCDVFSLLWWSSVCAINRKVYFLQKVAIPKIIFNNQDWVNNKLIKLAASI